MKRLIVLFAIALCLSACNALGVVNTPVPTVKAQQTVDFLQATHATVLRAELIYINQPPCGLKGSPKPPLCASYAVGVEMKRLDDKATASIANAQNAINTLGNNPAAIDAAIAAARLAISELQSYTNSQGART